MEPTKIYKEPIDSMITFQYNKSNDKTYRNSMKLKPNKTSYPERRRDWPYEAQQP